MSPCKPPSPSLATALCLLATGSGSAQDPRAAAFRADVEFLTSEQAAGRASGTEGCKRSLSYLGRRMREIGLRPLRALRGFEQPFLAPDPRPRSYLEDGTGLGIWDGRVYRDLALGREVLPFRGSEDGEVEAPVVFAGYGLRIPELEHDDYRDLDVRGKMVLVLRGGPGGPARGSPYRKHARALFFASKMAAAREAGAVGFLLCNRAPADAAGEREDLGVALRARGAAGMPAMWVSRDAARRLLEPCGVDLDCLQERLDRGDSAACRRPRGCRVRMRVRMGPPPTDRSTANVIGWLPGGDPALADEYVVVGAHHDHLGHGAFGSLGGPNAVGRLHPGADDNASGVAGLLAIAARLVEGVAPRRSILFVAFGAEELGLHGSRVFLDRGPVPRERIVAMVNLNMIGRGRTSGLSVEAVGSGAGLRALVRRHARKSPLEVELRELSTLRSDHHSFLRHRIPALLFHTGLHDQYHTPADVSSLVQVDAALEVAAVASAVVRELAGQEVAPEFTGRRWRSGRK